MGCAPSKIAHKRPARKSWYRPLSRSISALVRHPAGREADRSHVVSSTSSFNGLLKLEKLGYQEDFGSVVSACKNQDVYVNQQAIADDEDDFFLPLSASDAKKMIANMKVKPVKEEGDRQMLLEKDGHPETINTWELMEGLEDGGGTPSPLRGYEDRKLRYTEKSLSFKTVQELDSCFGEEAASPVWKKYFMQSEMERVKRSYLLCETPISPFSLSPIRSPSPNLLGDADSRNTSPLIQPSDSNSGLKLLLSPANSISGHTSPFRDKNTAHGPSLSFDGGTEHLSHGFSLVSGFTSPLKSPDLRSPLKSPDLKSPLKSPDLLAMRVMGINSKGSSSPLFDPAIMATFEQAVEAITVSKDHWLQPNEDESTMTASLLSSDDSSEKRPSTMDVTYESFVLGVRETKVASSKVLPVDEEEKKGWVLGSFEQRCPPRGEGKAVLYFTSLRGVRKTYEDCCNLRLILRGLGVCVDERDVWMHGKFKEELNEVMGNKKLGVPRLFIKGRYIGGAEEVKQLHEGGMLEKLVEGLETEDLGRKLCDGCGDVRFIPCLTCCGSCKILDEDDEIVECRRCNENGLIMCPICC